MATTGAEDAVLGVLQDPALLLGIPLALAGALCMSLGAQYQHSGVEKVERSVGSGGASGLRWAHLRALATRPSWLAGTLLLVLAVVCQLGAISVAPLMVVQPLGVVALLLTTILNSRASGVPPTKRSWTALAACIGGIGLFVGIAARYATKPAVANGDVVIILLLLLTVVVALLTAWLLFRQRLPALFYVSAAGLLYGFVATLAKILIDRMQEGNVDWFLALCVVALIGAGILGGYFVQTAYSSGPPDLVVAGLTVVDPLVAVVLAMSVLGESSAAPTWTFLVFATAGCLAAGGVVALARHHQSAEQNVKNPREQAPARSGSESPLLTASHEPGATHS